MIFSNNEINNWYKSKIGKFTSNKIINYLSNSVRVDYNQKIKFLMRKFHLIQLNV